MNLYNITDKYLQALENIGENEDNFDVQDYSNHTKSLDELAGDFEEKSSNIGAFILNLNAEIDSIKSVEDKLYKKRKSREKKQEWLREYLKFNMKKLGAVEIIAPDNTFKIKIHPGRKSIDIFDESKLNDKFFKITRAPVKDLIAKAIDSGEEVDGAKIIKKEYITIR